MWDSIQADAKNIGVRALKTFVQSFAAVLLATNEPISKQALIAALAAGVSAVWNSVVAIKKGA